MKTSKIYALFVMMVLLCVVNLACGEDRINAHDGATKKAKVTNVKTTPDNSKPSSETTPPAASTTAGNNPTNAVAKAILDRLEQAGKNYATVRTDIEFEVVNRMTGEKEQRVGWVAYQKETKDQPARIRVHFDTQRLENGPRTKEVVDYFYDGQYVTKDDYRVKTRTRWQMAAKGEQLDALKIGKGPFPVPFGQKTAEVLTYLQAVTRSPVAADPSGTDYLKLTALPGMEKEINFIRLEMWVTHKTNLPAKIVVRDENENVKTVVFSNTQTDSKFDTKLFNVPKPAGFELIVQRLDR